MTRCVVEEKILTYFKSEKEALKYLGQQPSFVGCCNLGVKHKKVFWEQWTSKEKKPLNGQIINKINNIKPYKE